MEKSQPNAAPGLASRIQADKPLKRLFYCPLFTASRFLAGCEGSFMLAGSCIRYANLYSSASLIGVKEVGNLTANTGETPCHKPLTPSHFDYANQPAKNRFSNTHAEN
ncbi:MAG: hypothetical protein DU480_00075 [Nitrosomonas sp.]